MHRLNKATHGYHPQCNRSDKGANLSSCLPTARVGCRRQQHSVAWVAESKHFDSQNPSFSKSGLMLNQWPHQGSLSLIRSHRGTLVVAPSNGIDFFLSLSPLSNASNFSGQRPPNTHHHHHPFPLLFIGGTVIIVCLWESDRLVGLNMESVLHRRGNNCCKSFLPFHKAI